MSLKRFRRTDRSARRYFRNLLANALKYRRPGSHLHSHHGRKRRDGRVVVGVKALTSIHITRCPLTLTMRSQAIRTNRILGKSSTFR